MSENVYVCMSACVCMGVSPQLHHGSERTWGPQLQTFANNLGEVIIVVFLLYCIYVVLPDAVVCVCVCLFVFSDE